MRIRSRLTLRMVALSAGLLALAFAAVYALEAAGRKEQFGQLLLNYARNRTIIHLELEGMNRSSTPFNEFQADVLPNAELYLYTFDNQLIFPKQPGGWRPGAEQILAVRNKGHAHFPLPDQKEMAGIHLAEEYNGLVAFSVARDDTGLQRLQTLKTTLSWVLLLSLPLLWLMAHWYAGKALVPIRDIIHSARGIQSTERSARLSPTGSKDELEELVTAFNELLARIDTAFQAQKNLIYNASHELRTPLAALHMSLDVLLLKESDPETQKQDIEKLKTQVHDLTTTTNQLLMMADMETRISEGRRPSHPINLAETLFKALEPLQVHPQIEQVRLHIDEELEGEEALRTLGDESLLAIALRNLIENALKYGQSQPVAVTLTRAAGEIIVAVKDLGPGIPPEEQKRIFEPFQRGQQGNPKQPMDENSENIPGHGLGLPLAARITALHGGRIELQSVPGQGSTFRLILPTPAPTESKSVL